MSRSWFLAAVNGMPDHIEIEMMLKLEKKEA